MQTLLTLAMTGHGGWTRRHEATMTGRAHQMKCLDDKYVCVCVCICAHLLLHRKELGVVGVEGALHGPLTVALHKIRKWTRNAFTVSCALFGGVCVVLCGCAAARLQRQRLKSTQSNATQHNATQREAKQSRATHSKAKQNKAEQRTAKYSNAESKQVTYSSGFALALF